jgi:hypothetical protein
MGADDWTVMKKLGAISRPDFEGLLIAPDGRGLGMGPWREWPAGK